MSTPVVVQGTAVPNPAMTSTAPTATATATSASPNNNNNNNHGMAAIEEKQETRCNDPFFALLFIVCVGAIIGVAAVYGPEALENTNQDAQVKYQGMIVGALIIAIISVIASAGGMAVMMCIPETLIKVALIFTVVMSALWMALAFASGAIGLGVMGAIFFVINVCYARAVWSRIPFASINLVTAVTAIKANLGVNLYAYLITIIGAAYSFAWAVAFVGVFDKTYQCDDVTNVCTNPNYGYLFLLFIAYFFGQQVWQYSIHTMVAGTVATWWFEPDECGCCSPAINNSFIRTFTTSFGSVCFGSFVVAVIRALQMLANSARDNGDAGFVACIAECILACLANIVEYLNQWAFIYVGIYGFPYIKAAKNVFTLFKNRGWEAVIADNLVDNTLFLVSIIVGAIMGAVAVIIQVTAEVFAPKENRDGLIYAFVIGFFIGTMLCSIMMSVIGSGVNAIIVLFAEAPAEFEQNYPDLSSKMREIWSTIYPGSV